MKNALRHLFSTSPSCCVSGDVGDLALRLVAGLSMAYHGLQKLPPPQQMIDGLTQMGIPFPTVSSWLAMFAELGGGALLALGFLTRPAAFLIAFTMFIAAFVAHRNDPYQVKELAFLYLAISFMYTLRGAGRLSVDRAIERTMTRDEPRVEPRGFSVVSEGTQRH